MRAIQIKEFGGPEVLELVDLPVPVAGDGEVLIRVSRAGLNFADTHQRENEYVAKQSLPMIPGGEIAGVREDSGERVVALCGHGGYAQYVTAPQALSFPIPDGVGDDVALALLIQGLTAFHLYRTAVQLRVGESVVVHSAAGGVGSLAVQLAKPLGAGRVIATASSQDRRDLAVDLGADVAVDGGADGLTDRLLEANGGKSVDVILEMAGGAIFDQSYAALAPFGRICAYGISSQEKNRVSTASLLKSSRGVIGFWLFHFLHRPEMFREPLVDLFARARRGELRAQIGSVYALDQAAQAQMDISARRTTGKVTIDPTA